MGKKGGKSSAKSKDANKDLDDKDKQSEPDDLEKEENVLEEGEEGVEEITEKMAENSLENDDCEREKPQQPQTHYPLVVDYCGVCTMPVEYCQYSPSYEQCRRWLEKNKPEVFAQLFLAQMPGGTGRSADVIEAEKMAADHIRDNLLDGAGSMSKRQTRGGKGNSTKMAAVTGPKGKINPKSAAVKIFTAPRGKKKAVTVVTGLSEFGVDLKAASKFFASKYSCGASVTGDDEIVVQGDVKDDMLELVSEKWPDIPDECVKDLGTMKR